MTGLFSETRVRGKTVKNRVVLPPMVCFGWAGEDGLVSGRHKCHYSARAAGGTGIIVVEATCVSPEGRLSMDQLGLWNDAQIPGMKSLADACHAEGVLPLVQIHHAGLKTVRKSVAVPMGPSVISGKPDAGGALTIEEITGIINAFTMAAVRAKTAGFAGVELHGAHGYLLSQFASPLDNQRTDAYGGSLENRLRLHVEIGRSIRAACGDDFILSIRIGCNEPDLDGGVAVAKHLEENGFDMLHVSASGHDDGQPSVPERFPYNWIVWGGAAIHKAVGIPVIVVNDIRTPERAQWLVENGWADFVAIGKDYLTDARWGAKAQSGEPIISCLHCKKGCRWFSSGDRCPRRTPASE